VKVALVRELVRVRARKAVLGRGERGGPAAPGPSSCAARLYSASAMHMLSRAMSECQYIGCELGYPEAPVISRVYQNIGGIFQTQGLVNGTWAAGVAGLRGAGEGGGDIIIILLLLLIIMIIIITRGCAARGI
jgi:hypothetical protein